jgi:hypothetical protein
MSKEDWKAEQATTREEAPKEKDPITLLTGASAEDSTSGDPRGGGGERERERENLELVGLTNLWEDPNCWIAKSSKTAGKATEDASDCARTKLGFELAKQPRNPGTKSTEEDPTPGVLYFTMALVPARLPCLGFRPSPTHLNLEVETQSKAAQSHSRSFIHERKSPTFFFLATPPPWKQTRFVFFSVDPCGCSPKS